MYLQVHVRPWKPGPIHDKNCSKSGEGERKNTGVPLPQPRKYDQNVEKRQKVDCTTVMVNFLCQVD